MAQCPALNTSLAAAQERLQSPGIYAVKDVRLQVVQLEGREGTCLQAVKLKGRERGDRGFREGGERVDSGDRGWRNGDGGWKEI